MSPATARSASTPAADFSKFRDVRAWIFDLDNTLYPSTSGLFPQVQARIREYVQRALNKTAEEAHDIQRDFYDRYGATLLGLIEEYQVDPDEFLEYVHDVDHSMLTPDPRLASAIGRLPGKHYILTNGSRPHAEKVAAALGFTREFHDVFDIVWAGGLSKPSPEVYDQLVRHTGIDPTHSAMFEDLARNLIAPHRLGIRTTLVVPAGAAGTIEAATHGAVRGYGQEVDFVTDDLGGFLEKILLETTDG